MPALLAADADVAEAAGCASCFEGDRGDVFALLGGGVEAVDFVAGGEVEEVGFGGGDIVSELPVSKWSLLVLIACAALYKILTRLVCGRGRSPCRLLRDCARRDVCRNND